MRSRSRVHRVPAAMAGIYQSGGRGQGGFVLEEKMENHGMHGIHGKGRAGVVCAAHLSEARSFALDSLNFRVFRVFRGSYL